jgi:hypothetical protein
MEVIPHGPPARRNDGREPSRCDRWSLASEARYPSLILRRDCIGTHERAINPTGYDLSGRARTPLEKSADIPSYSGKLRPSRGGANRIV